MDYHLLYVIAVTLVVTLHLQINPEASLGSTCGADNDTCDATTETCNTDTLSCECNSNSTSTGTGCTSRSGHKDPCYNDTSCVSGLTCYSSSACVCPDGNYYPGNLSCVSIDGLIPSFSLSSSISGITVNLTSKPGAGSLYTSTYEANLSPGNSFHSLTQDSTTINGLTAATEYTIKVRRILTLKDVGREQTTKLSSPQIIRTRSGHKDPCYNDTSCVSGLTCYSSSACVCPDGNYYPGNLSCVSIDGLIPSFSLSSSISGITVNLTSKPGAGSLYTSTYEANLSPGNSFHSLTQDSTTINGLTAATEYTIKVRRILTLKDVGREQTTKLSSPQIIRTRSGHKDPCYNDTSCVSGLTCYSSSACVCPDGNYYPGNLSCVSIDGLIPSFSLSSSISGITVNLTSKPGAGSLYTSTYEANLSPGNSFHSLTQDSTTINGLTAATEYTIKVRRILTLKDVGREQTTKLSSPQIIRTRSGHKDPCYNDTSCVSGLTCYSSSACVCPDGNYYPGNLSCVSIDGLIPSFSLSSSISGITVNLTSKPGAGSLYTSTYEANLSPGNSFHSLTQDSTTINGLTAATEYTIKVRRILTLKDVGREQTTKLSSPHIIRTKSSHGQFCNSSDDCAKFPNSSLNLICYNRSQDSKCLCPDGFYIRDSLPCLPNSRLRPQITDNTPSYNSIKIVWTMHSVPNVYTSRYELEYRTGSSMNITANGIATVTGLDPNTQYQVTIKCYISFGGREQSLSSNTVNVTTSKSGHKGPCSNNDSCDARLSCYTQRSVCVCPDGNFTRGSLPCVPISELNPTFSLSSDLTNITVTLTNKPAAGDLYTSTYSAHLNPGGVYNLSSDVTRITGLTEGKVYSVTVTRTLTLKDVGRNQTTGPPAQYYSTKVSYNKTCISNNTCIDDHAHCYGEGLNGGRCLCAPRYYWRDRCISIDELAPRYVQAYTLDTKSVIVRWSVPAYRKYVSGYRVDVNPTIHGDPIDVAGDEANSTLLEGLHPGTQYTFTVKSDIRYEGRVEYAPGDPTNTVTRPAKIGKLDEPHSNFSAPNMKIAFQPANQTFLYYTVTLKGDDGYNKTDNASHHTENYYYAEFDGITPGNFYNIEIVTVSFENSQSETFTDRRRAMVAQAGEVVDLRNGTLTSRSVIINWERPEKPNGDLFEYSLEISQDDDCKSRIIFNCTECPRNKTEVQGTAPPCQNLTTITITKDHIDNETYVVEYNVTSLDPDTNYDILAVAYNEEGRGKGSTPLQIHTYSEPARKPKAVSISNLTSDTVTVNWIPETPRPGTTSYVVGIHERNTNNTDFTWIKNETVLGYDSKHFEVSNLSSYWEYQFFVLSQSEVPPASEFVDTDVIRTLESAPIRVDSLEDSEVPGVYNKVRLSWKCPPQKDGRNGDIQYATVRYKTDTVRDGVTPKIDNKTFKENGSCIWDVKLDITPEFNYTFTVFISNSFAGDPRVIKRYMPPGPAVIMEGSVSKKQKAVSEKENSVPLYIQPKLLLDGRNGLVVRSGIVVCKTKCPANSKKRETKNKDYHEGLDNWQKAVKIDFNVPYKATSPNWSSDVTLTDEGPVYEIGKNSSCDKSDENGFCNGPLPAGTTFEVYVFVCTVAGCDESEPVSIQTKEPPSNIGVIVGAVCGVLAAVIIVIAVVVYLKLRKKKSKPQKVEETANDENELIQKKRLHNKATKRPIVLSDFPEKVDQMHRDSNLLFSEEFEDICALSPKHNAVASETGSNKLKNRYVNILPFDHSRVKLRQLEDEDEESDYLNANYIPGYRYVREYIATQGPMTGTISDFWRMIWEQKVPIIVMLSDLQEKGRPKVDRYYPENMEPVNYGDIRVEMTNFSPLSKYVIRIFKIELGDEVRTVRHYFLPGWQDFGANLTSDNVIDFIKSVRMEIKPNNTGPMCIHCSAGVGRTGTYITLDVFQQHIDEEVMDKELDVFDFVMKMRQNRSYMVQTEKQYIFIHDTIKEMVLRKKKEIAERDKNVYMNTGIDEDLYVNQAFETDPSDIYMNVDTRTDKPTTAL